MPSIEEKIAQNKIIFITSQIDAETASNIIFKILDWTKDTDEVPINLYVSSHSLSYVNVMAIYDVLANIKNPINVFCMGHVGGFSSLFLTLSKQRYALKHTTISLDQPLGMVDSGANQQTEMEILAVNTTKKRNEFEKILSEKLNKDLKEIHDLVEENHDFKAEEALKLGLIDQILE